MQKQPVSDRNITSNTNNINNNRYSSLEKQNGVRKSKKSNTDYIEDIRYYDQGIEKFIPPPSSAGMGDDCQIEDIPTIAQQQQYKKQNYYQPQNNNKNFASKNFNNYFSKQSQDKQYNVNQNILSKSQKLLPQLNKNGTNILKQSSQNISNRDFIHSKLSKGELYSSESDPFKKSMQAPFSSLLDNERSASTAKFTGKKSLDNFLDKKQCYNYKKSQSNSNIFSTTHLKTEKDQQKISSIKDLKAFANKKNNSTTSNNNNKSANKKDISKKQYQQQQQQQQKPIRYKAHTQKQNKINNQQQNKGSHIKSGGFNS